MEKNRGPVNSKTGQWNSIKKAAKRGKKVKKATGTYKTNITWTNIHIINYKSSERREEKKEKNLGERNNG